MEGFGIADAHLYDIHVDVYDLMLCLIIYPHGIGFLPLCTHG